MIEIKDAKDCVGCNACVQICPRQCIESYRDELGFMYPKVDKQRCIECTPCEKVCPVINQATPRRPLKVYAAKNKDEEVRLQSSSGGVFTALAQKVLQEGGVVFGARFDENFNIVHDFAETKEDLRKFQGSKYVQSNIGESFKRAAQFLKDDRQVLFSGTPCQLAALRLFLGKAYEDRLICHDIVCHGVPGPYVWRDYLHDLSSQLDIKPEEISRLSFRDKRLGWRRFGLAVDAPKSFFQPLDENPYIQVFLKNLDLRPSCYACPVKCGKSHSDITLADFWKLRKFHSDIFDETGVSLLMVNSRKGLDLVRNVDLLLTPSSYENGLYGNPAIEKSAILPPEREVFISLFKRKDCQGILNLLKGLSS